MITTHVLDTSRGQPAAGVPVRLERMSAAGDWSLVGEAATDTDGRLRDLTGARPVAPGTYRLTFDTAAYFRASGVTGFYPEVQVVFDVRETHGHHHVPLLLSPYGYSTYRGS